MPSEMVNEGSNIPPEQSKTNKEQISEIIQSNAAYSFLKAYIVFTAKNGKFASKYDFEQHVNKIISAMMDNGDIAITVIEDMKEYISQIVVNYRQNDTYQMHQFTESVFEQMLETMGGKDISDINKSINNYIETYKRLQEIKESLIDNFWLEISDNVRTVLIKYNKYLDKSFMKYLGA